MQLLSLFYNINNKTVKLVNIVIKNKYVVLSVGNAIAVVVVDFIFIGD